MPFKTRIVLVVNKGDKVRLLFENLTGTYEHIATITKVVQRYGRINGGKDKQNPLIYYTPPIADVDNTGVSNACDAVFVEEILEHAPGFHHSENIYRDAREENKLVAVKRVNGYLIGDLFGCIALCLAKLDIQLITPLHPIRVRNLYEQSKQGHVSFPTMKFGEGDMIIREKPFFKWVKSNATRLVYHRSELDSEETQRNMEMEEAYKDLENKKGV